MVRRRGLRAVLALLLGFMGVFVAIQPASAAVVVPAGQAGHACSGYTDIDLAGTLYFQTCAWASWNPPSSRMWFTGHFGNTRDYAVTIDVIDIGYHINGSERITWCPTQHNLVIPAHGVKASTDSCALARTRAAVQGSIVVRDESSSGTYITPYVLSPTLQIQG